jgi:hypothetical protein
MTTEVMGHFFKHAIYVVLLQNINKEQLKILQVEEIPRW